MLLGLVGGKGRPSARLFSTTAQAWKKSAPGRGRARKSPATLLRLHAEGKLKGAEAAAAEKLLAEQDTAHVEKQAEKKGVQSMTLSEARNVIRVRGLLTPVPGSGAAAQRVRVAHRD